MSDRLHAERYHWKIYNVLYGEGSMSVCLKMWPRPGTSSVRKCWHFSSTLNKSEIGQYCQKQHFTALENGQK